MDINSIEKQVSASMAIENIIPSIQGRKITRDFLEGKITSKTAIKRILKLHGVRA